MKKKLISLSLISFASVLGLSACSQAAYSVNEPQVVYNDGDHRGLPHYRASELPDNDTVYDLTKEMTYRDIKPATQAEFEEFVKTVVGENLLSLVKETFPEMWNYVLKYNVFTERELYDLADVVGRIFKVVEGKEVDLADLAVDIAARVDLDKFFYLFNKMKTDKKAFAETKRFAISIANSTFEELDYRAAHKYLKAHGSNVLSEEAEAESYVWDNFLVNGDDMELFETISDFFANPDIRVFLRFVNLFSKTMAKNFTKHEMGFVFTNLHLINDEEYEEVCYRYMMNNASSFVKHLGNIIKGIHITDDSWMMMLRGLQTVAAVTGGDEDFVDGDKYIATDYLAEKAYKRQVDFIYNSIDPHGIRVLLKFVGNVLNALPKKSINDIMSNMENPDAIDVVAIENIYLEQYGKLSRGDKETLDNQCETFGIDINAFNVNIEGFDPEESTPLDYLMEVLNANLIGPFMEYFTEGIAQDPIYPQYAHVSSMELRSGSTKLVLKQGVDWGWDELVNYLGLDSTFHVNFNLDGNYVYSGPTYFDDRQYRDSWNTEGEIDTSKPGNGFIIVKYHVPLTIDMWNDEKTDHSEVLYDYNFEWKLYYYVVDSHVDEYYSFGFREFLDLNGYDKGKSVARDSLGNIAKMDYKGILNVTQNTTYADNELIVHSDTYSFHYYDETQKRYIDLEDESGFSSMRASIKLHNLDTSTLGLHYTCYDVTYQDTRFTPTTNYCTVKYVVAYRVVESIEYTISDGFFDPGFGW